MTIQPLFVAFAVLIMIFLCVIVPVILYMRQVAMLHDIQAIQDKLDSIKADYKTFLRAEAELTKEVVARKADINTLELSINGVSESLRSLSNKISSRLRTERKNAKVEEVSEIESEDDDAKLGPRELPLSGFDSGRQPNGNIPGTTQEDFLGELVPYGMEFFE